MKYITGTSKEYMCLTEVQHVNYEVSALIASQGVRHKICYSGVGIEGGGDLLC